MAPREKRGIWITQHNLQGHMSENDRYSDNVQRRSPDGFHEALALIKSMIESRSFRKERLEERDVVAAIQTLADTAINGDTAGRLTAISILGKASEISKPIAAFVRPFLDEGLQMELPPTGAWGNADDRYYLAKAVSTSESSWVKTYAASEFATGELSEKASRGVWANITITKADNLAEALNAISAALQHQLKSLNNPVDFSYRKLARIAEALEQVVLAADVPVGSGFGKAFTRLVQLAGGFAGAESIKPREEAALRVLDLLIQVLRLRFEALLDSDFYRAVGIVRAWWRPATPPTQIETRSDRIAELAANGLHVLARQGVADEDLRRSIASALGQTRTDAAGKKVAHADPSLDPAISFWLATGRRAHAQRTNEAVQEVNEAALDELVVKLLLEVTASEGGASALDMVADLIEVLEPSQASVIRAGAARLRQVSQWGLAIASKRRLAVFGARGDVVPFDPAIHEAQTPIQRSSNVRIVLPGVTKQNETKAAVLISKAVVERI